VLLVPQPEPEETLEEIPLAAPRVKPPHPAAAALTPVADTSLDGVLNEALAMSTTAKAGHRVRPVEEMPAQVRKQNWRDFVKAMRITGFITGHVVLFSLACVPFVISCLTTAMVFSHDVPNVVRGYSLALGSQCFYVMLCLFFKAMDRPTYIVGMTISILPFFLLGVLFWIIGSLELAG
jgi:hypothetical protein